MSRDLRQASREDYTTVGAEATLYELQVGAALRSADALDRMAKAVERMAADLAATREAVERLKDPDGAERIERELRAIVPRSARRA